MTDALFEAVAKATRELTKYGFSAEEFAAVVQQNSMTDAEVLAVAKVFDYLIVKKDRSRVEFLLRTSRLPTLSAIYSHKNLAFIGRSGTGKTHLAQAFGRTCCEHGFKTYFIKMTELRDRMTVARRTGRESSLLSSPVRPSCLIIDEVGHCEFDKENTRLFFDMVDRHYQKEGYSNMVFTSNRDPSQWKENFCENDALLCALDRIFDDAVVFTIKGESFRGRKLETVSLRTAGVYPEHRVKHNIPGLATLIVGDFFPAEIGCFLPAQTIYRLLFLLIYDYFCFS